MQDLNNNIFNYGNKIMMMNGGEKLISRHKLIIAYWFNVLLILFKKSSL